MSLGTSIAEIAALVGDPARENMLFALMDGRALTAGELAYAGRITPQTASMHLRKLTESRLLVVAKQGRHRYYRLASAEVARMLESIASVAVDAAPRFRPPSPKDHALRHARLCYDHLAGRLGVAFADALTARGILALGEDGGEVTETGTRFLTEFGIDLDRAARQKRCFCRICIDWTERRPHIAGAIGAALATRCFDLKWIERVKDSRAVTITASGRRGLAESFGLELAEMSQVNPRAASVQRIPPVPRQSAASAPMRQHPPASIAGATAGGRRPRR
ncbi:MAG: winged helix-turn-helix transcriptional regulator [Proteobacteria bacterium]|nr:winged helix-turn-helix transcriptional regulator [Pseudomonadota bacterium]MBI3496661.1 winged helix-turn-helix transcriptional regulator [Pseudomonadota bacterium]